MPRWSPSDPAADRRLVLSLNAGDEAAFGALYDAYAECLHDYTLSMAPESKVAADIVHDTFIDACRRAPRLLDRSRLRAWLYGAARRRCLQRGRPRNLFWDWTGGPAWAGEVAEADLGLSPAELRELLEMALARLEFADQEALFLTLRHGLTTSELAAVLGFSPRRAGRLVGTARTRMESAVAAELRSLARRCAAGQSPARAVKPSQATAELVSHTAILDRARSGRGATPRFANDDLPDGVRPAPERPRPAAAEQGHPPPQPPAPEGSAPSRETTHPPTPSAAPGQDAPRTSATDATSAAAYPSSPPSGQGAAPGSGAGSRQGAASRLGAASGSGGVSQRGAGSGSGAGSRQGVGSGRGGGAGGGAGYASGAGYGVGGGRAWEAVAGAGLERVRRLLRVDRGEGGSRRGAEPPEWAGLAQHVSKCQVCRRRGELSAVALLGLAPAPVLPAALRHRVLHTASDPELAGHRADISGRGGSLSPEGLPRQPDVPSPFTRRWMFVGGGAVGALTTALAAALLLGPVSSDLRWPIDPRPHPSVGGRVPEASDRTTGRVPSGRGPGGTGRPVPGGPFGPGRPGPPDPQFTGSPTAFASPSSSPTPSEPPNVPKVDPSVGSGVLSVGPSSMTLNNSRRGVIVVIASQGPVSWKAVSSTDRLSLSKRAGSLSAGDTTQVVVSLRTRAVTPPGEATVTFTDRKGKRQIVRVVWPLLVL